MIISLDSNVLIASLSQYETYSHAAQHIIRSINDGKYQAVVSALVYGEVLGLGAMAEDSLDLDDFFRHIRNLSIIPADSSVCLKAGKLRKQHGPALKLPDAIHLATALVHKADSFITDDHALAGIAKTLITTKILAGWKTE